MQSLPTLRKHKMKTAYLDCFSGISGDMFLGALLDAGLSLDELINALKTLAFGGYRIEKIREARSHISGTRFVVHLESDAHAHRNMKDIRQIILKGDLSEQVKGKSIKIFENLAKAEGKIHNRPPDDVHFHEVGAVDSIIDIVGAVFGIERLGIDSLSVSALLPWLRVC